ncbi:aspartic proteinase-like protein 1 [Selaginella moellendorffii]|uniref:aspartic proteinase-like protein 1 n=1 Tax=Selaginella moellendorffii TaxID=88036 RepID=UPI000D1C42B0|nr:aspartic proteinase-like protein 1 [Selaginella moellendorffii]|eukprot:XP_024543299.1 aspartic proteinase-like protein 1 [Selaginella moellendorffii]
MQAFLVLLFNLAFASSLDFRIIHRYSDEARGLLGLGEEPAPPVRGSLDYHRLLLKHDLSKHGRELLTGNDSLALLQGNYTEDLGPRFGGIHYTFVDIGTPNVSFLVALDTGSDLFWVPCDCKHCQSVSPSEFPTLKKRLTYFTTNSSTTNKLLTCGDKACSSSSCTGNSSVCPYTVRYLSENTSTSGKLVEDVIHLFKPATSSAITARIIFGCGEQQTGLFLRGGAPNGLLGLGPGDVSLPSMLAKDGLINDTFSMCFDTDGSGRILFGDRGAKSQQTTSFIPNSGVKSAYDVGIEQFTVGGRNITFRSFNALFDTGTTLTYLQSDAYQRVTEAFDSQINLRRITNVDLSPYEYCYRLNGNEDTVTDIPAPSLSLTFQGGGNFSVVDPLVLVIGSDSRVLGFCLAVLESNFPIIGQNFMGGYRFAFDRERSTLGWSPANCYHLEDGASFEHTPSPINQPVSQNRNDNSPFLKPPQQEAAASFGITQTSSVFVVLFFLFILF